MLRYTKIFFTLNCAFTLIAFSDTVARAQNEESSTRIVEKAANRQIEDCIRRGQGESLDPRGCGRIIVTTNQKLEAAEESTAVINDDPNAAGTKLRDACIKRPTIALALGGGGARGAAHIGVLRVLQEAHIPIDYIVGNSMGAIVGGLYAAGVPLDRIQEIALDSSLRKAYMPAMVPPRILIGPVTNLMHPLRKHYAGLWSGNQFGQFLENQFPTGIENVEDTPIRFSAVATNLIDGKAYRITEGRLSTAIRASASLPTLLQPVAIGDKLFVDGAVRANLPASGARDTGADIVIAILVDEPLRKMPATQFRHLKGIAKRFGDILVAVADARQLPYADLVINPDVSGLPVIDSSKDDVRKAILAGEAATRSALPAIRKAMSDSTLLRETVAKK